MPGHTAEFNNPRSITLGLFVFLLSIAAAVAGCNLISLPDEPGGGGGGEDDTEQPSDFPESAYWSELADQVAAGGADNTDIVLLVANRLKDRGLLKDLSRLDGFAQKRTEISESNMADVVRQIRGE